jgi:hypothetical protein
VWQGGVRPFIPHDTGTAGFPDGAGLYWKSSQPMPGFPFGGVMFIGHNTDAEGTHASRRPGGRSPGEPCDPVMPTWKRLYKTFELAGFDPREMFFTNVYVGLKAGTLAEGPFQGAKDPSFLAWCRAFLDEQIQLMRPRAIVTLGAVARDEFGLEFGRITHSVRAGASAVALKHPVARDRRAAEEGAVLREILLTDRVPGPAPTGV